MSGPRARAARIMILMSLFAGGMLFADPSGDGHVHNESTAVGDGSSSLPMGSAASQMPSELLEGTSFANVAQRREPEPLEQPNRVDGNGMGATRIEDRIGRPGEDPILRRAPSAFPRSRVP